EGRGTGSPSPPPFCLRHRWRSVPERGRRGMGPGGRRIAECSGPVPQVRAGPVPRSGSGGRPLRPMERDRRNRTAVFEGALPGRSSRRRVPPQGRGRPVRVPARGVAAADRPLLLLPWRHGSSRHSRTRDTHRRSARRRTGGRGRAGRNPAGRGGMTIGVTTPTGNVGAHLLRLLVQAGERPRALLRDPARLPADVAGHVDAVAMDSWDAGAVAEATRGLTALYWVSPTATDRDPLQAHAVAAAGVRAAVQRNGIGRVVVQSSVGAEKRTGAGEIDGLAATELALDATGAAVTHLRCGYFFTNLLMEAEAIGGGVLATAMDLDRPLPWVAPADIAAVAAVRLLSVSWTGRCVQA